MRDPGRHGTSGAAPAEVLIFLATLSIAAALLYPAWSARGFRASVQDAIADVETLSTAARSARDLRNRWPTPAPPGEAPGELSALGDPDGIFSRTGYALAWTSWEVVDSVEAPPPADVTADGDAPQESADQAKVPIVRTVGAVAVHSGDEALLAELHEFYSDRASFVLDTLWLLVLPERAEAPARPQ